ncbi:MAG: DtxR family transcriptional regulator, Mn-dependent transcriptional regulator [Methanomicrobiaceae archaeon]|nr:DtxR family transcriptional regulator, Mn-dependent transcriptional regulator [Methanomicrobiaceae archaeon]
MLPSMVEDYLEAILEIAENSGRPPTVEEIAAALKTGKETASSTIAALAREGYLEQVGDAVRLTEKGAALASKVARKHTVLQCFLTEMLGVDTNSASREACTLEHGISDDTIERLSSYMSGTATMPGRMRRRRGQETVTLLDCNEGDIARVALMRGPGGHRRLLDLGVFPGEIVEVRRKLPNNSVVVRVKGCDIAISPEIARSIFVESCP